MRERLNINISPADRDRWLRYWLPALLAGAVAWFAFLTLGETPFVRSSGLALVIVGVTLTLRRLGWLLAVSGGLALAFSPAFWQQTGGAGALVPATIVLALAVAIGIGGAVILLSQRPYIALLVALALFVIAFAVLFLGQVGMARSLRLTVLISAWLIYLLSSAVLETNPRPEEQPPSRLRAQYRAGLLLLLGIGTWNDPLMVLFVPALVIGLAQANTRIPWWYWGLLAGISVIGVSGMVAEYVDEAVWGLTVAQASSMGNLPYLVPAALRDGSRWVELLQFIAGQFTVVGIILSVIGMSRLSRWYPVLGGVMLVAYGMFFTFGLAYFGRDRAVLLLPLLIIQVVWMTYAVFALGQWMEKTVTQQPRQWVRWFAPIAYIALPLLLLFDIAS